TCRWGKVCHRGTNCLTGKRVGPTSSLWIIAGDCIPDEDSPTTIPQRHFDGDSFPQRHVAGESPDMSLGKALIVVVCDAGGKSHLGEFLLRLKEKDPLKLWSNMIDHVKFIVSENK
ncbi:hypothetical protein Tco_1179771, partial [Tanacetum coccineum]